MLRLCNLCVFSLKMFGFNVRLSRIKSYNLRLNTDTTQVKALETELYSCHIKSTFQCFKRSRVGLINEILLNHTFVCKFWTVGKRYISTYFCTDCSIYLLDCDVSVNTTVYKCNI
uniref:Uncharacterized protein n=1 Tax=Pararge aegeria TaxID=116150 RepID=S4P738_9NEOP